MSGVQFLEGVPARHVLDRLAKADRKEIVSGKFSILKLTDVRLTGAGLLNGRQLVAFLQQLGIDQPIESYGRPYAAVATDLATGREIWLQSGPIHESVRASIARPGILSPANNEGVSRRARGRGTAGALSRA
jgi:NTE family protein